MKIIGWIASILIGLFLLGVLLDACSSPASRAAYDKADRIDAACEKMMSDAALGDQRRNVRQACDNMKK